MDEVIRKAWGDRLKPGFLPHGRLFRSSVGVSLNFPEIVPRQVTLQNERHLGNVFQDDVKCPRTLTTFKEVMIVPFDEAMPDEVLEFLRAPKIKRKTHPIKFARLIFHKLADAIEGAWNPRKFHLVWHSSGFDSRLISLAIRYLYKKHGPDWLGGVLFMECNCESEPFKDIMRVEGWSNDQWAVCSVGPEPHANSFGFTHVWERLNGHVSYPFNFWYDPVAQLQQEDRIPCDDKLQCFSGLFANEILKVTAYGGLELAIRKIYDNMHCGNSRKGDFIWPFLNLTFIESRLVHDVGFGKYNRRVVEIVAPEVAKICRIGNRVLRTTRCRRISEDLMKQVLEDYGNTWYAKNAYPVSELHPTRSLVYCMWWGHWVTASLCEHLLKEGHTIEVTR